MQKHPWFFNETCLKEQLLPTYTNINIHDPAARDEEVTVQFKRQLIERQIDLRQAELEELENINSNNYLQLDRALNNQELRSEIILKLKSLRDQHYCIQRNKISNKLNRLYRGKICLIEKSDSFINLSDTELTENQKKFLNLGLNCHIQPKYDANKKKIELELLYNTFPSPGKRQQGYYSK